MSLMRVSPFFLFSVLLWAGCASTPDNGGFVRPVDTGLWRTFEVEPAMTTGFNWDGSDAMVVERVSGTALTDAFIGKGYEPVGEGMKADFRALAKWRKYAGQRGSLFNPVDPAQGRLETERPANGFAVRYGLVLEIFDGGTGELLWRSDLPAVFEAIRFSEDRVIQSVQRAAAGFPDRAAPGVSPSPGE